MEKKPQDADDKIVPNDVIIPINIGKSTTIEEALGISPTRFMQLGFIMDDIWTKKLSKAEALFYIANLDKISDIEKTYLGFKLNERIVNICLKKIPFVGKKLLAELGG